MNLLTRIANRLGWFPRPQVARLMRKASQTRGYAAAVVDRLTQGWSTAILSADAEIRQDLTKLRARARELERDDDYARRYFRLLINNVLGAEGLRLQMRLPLPAPSVPSVPSAPSDTPANDTIEWAWWAWGRAEHCTVTRRATWRATQKLILRALARDGSVLILVHRGFPNAFGFALQVLEADHLDSLYEANLPNGHRVRLGVESTPLGEPVAYHLLTAHPGDTGVPLATRAARIRVPALTADGAEPLSCLHLFAPERPSQSEGVTWLCSPMRRLNMLGGYEEAELVAARVAACKGGFFKHTTPEGWQGPEEEDGQLVQDLEPGSFEDLPVGTDFAPYSPEHPSTAFPQFVKANLRGASAGLGVSYTSLANDLEAVNYSSIRAGLLEEREEWKEIQTTLAEDLCQRLFDAWLPFAILSGQLDLPIRRLAEARAAADWKGRRWPWVDPLKDVQAASQAEDRRYKSRKQIIADMGAEEEEVLQEIQAGQALDAKLGLPPVSVPSVPSVPSETDDDEAPTKPMPKDD